MPLADWSFSHKVQAINYFQKVLKLDQVIHECNSLWQMPISSQSFWFPYLIIVFGIFVLKSSSKFYFFFSVCSHYFHRFTLISWILLWRVLTQVCALQSAQPPEWGQTQLTRTHQSLTRKSTANNNASCTRNRYCNEQKKKGKLKSDIKSQ